VFINSFGAVSVYFMVELIVWGVNYFLTLEHFVPPDSPLNWLNFFSR